MALPETCWDDGLFVMPPKADDPLRCIICCGVMQDAVQCPNQHCFGLPCLKLSLAIKNECPTCRKPLQLSAAQPALIARSLVDRLEVKCANREEGCDAVFALEARENHESQCPYANVTCTHKCGRVLPRREMRLHEIVCDAKLFDCPLCKTRVSNTSSATHKCLTSLVDKVVTLEATVASLTSKLDQQTTFNTSLEHQLKEMFQLVRQGGLGPGRAMASSAASDEATAAVSNILREGQRVSKLSTPKLKMRKRRPETTDLVVGRASFGCLKPGQVGQVLKDEHDHQPFHVIARDGGTYWYRESEVGYLATPGTPVGPAVCVAGLPVVRGEHWKWGNQDGRKMPRKPGFVVGVRDGGWAQVEWADGSANCYRIGATPDLAVASMQ
eukprot:m.12662 g.12662  ORF g.12662 m.12662 type:complete len:384 (-) comp5850_c1_seq1:79-1230(-)